MFGCSNLSLISILADKVGPHPDVDNVKQGGLGEYFSKEGKDYYGFGSDKDFGNIISTYAKPGDHPGGHESFGIEHPENNIG
jgi:hypothetical protein